MTVKELWPHQQEIVELAKTTNVFLADDTGAGKTLSSIEAARQQWDDQGPVLPAPILVFCVKTAKLQWLANIISQHPGDPVWLANKGDKQLFMDLRRKKVWIIAHFHVMHDRALWQYIYRQVFAAMIIDEAHRIKGHKAVWAIRIRNLKARRKIAATATPQEKSVADMYNILRFLQPGKYPSYWGFVGKYCLTEDNYYSENPNVLGTNPDTFPELAAEIAPFYRRRMKSEVRDDMPPLIEESVPVAMTVPQARFYNFLEKSDDLVVWDEDYLHQPLIVANKLALLIRLWQAATFPKTVPGSKVTQSGKLLWVDDFIKDNPNESLIIFTWFRDTAAHLASKYSQLPPYMGGHDNPMPTENDQVIVGTIGSMGESLDLPWISTAIFMNRSRSTIQMKQAKDRIYRMTITEAKRAIYLESRKPSGGETIDQVIYNSLRAKHTDAEFVAAAIKHIQQSVT